MALEEMHSRNKQDDRDCGRTARQMEDIMAWRDDKARATLILLDPFAGFLRIS
jgi:hypothetical protein